MDLSDIKDYGAALQRLAAKAATVPILHSLVHLRNLVEQSLRLGVERAKVKCKADNRKWSVVKEGLFRRHSPVPGIVAELLRSRGSALLPTLTSCATRCVPPTHWRSMMALKSLQGDDSAPHRVPQSSLA